MRRRALLFGGVAALVAGVMTAPAVAAAASGCTPRVLDMGANGNIIGDNSRDTFVGSLDIGSVHRRAMLFRADGTTLNLGLPDAYAVDMNSSGIVVGNAEADGPDQYAFAWYHGRAVRLPRPSWATGDVVRRINDRGDAAGFVIDRKGHTHPAVWIRLTFVRVLPIPPGFADAEAHAINGRGEIVGIASAPSNGPDGVEQDAWRWHENGSNAPLRPDYRGGFEQAWALNNRGWAGGGLDYGGKPGLFPAVWRNGSLIRLGPTGSQPQFGLVYNGDEHGDYVGSAAYSPTDKQEHNFVTRIGTHVLYTMRPLSGNLQDFSGAFTVIDNDGAYGTVVGGYSASADGTPHATLWTCAWQQVTRPPAAASSGGPASIPPSTARAMLSRWVTQS
jgi:hypothetical protein